MDGPAAQARFYNLRGATADPDGNLVVADSSNHCVRALSAADGMVTTLAGVQVSPWDSAKGEHAQGCGTPGRKQLPAIHNCTWALCQQDCGRGVMPLR